jgi:hypothetical protein
MPSIRINPAARRMVILAAVAGCSLLYFFSSWKNSTVTLPLDAGRSPEVVPWVGIHPGQGEVFVINPVYPPHVVGKFDKETMRVIPVASSDAVQGFASLEPVFLVNPAYPPQVTGTVDPLGPQRRINWRSPDPVPAVDPDQARVIVPGNAGKK